MGAFKQFLSTDVIVSPLVVNKSFSFEGSASFTANGIGLYLGANYTSSNLSTSSLEYDQKLKYNSIKQLYYTNYIPNPISGSPYITDYLGQVVEDNSQTDIYSRFYNYESTTLFQTNSLGYTSNYGFERFIFTGSAINKPHISIISIPKTLFGDYINPNTFSYTYDYDGGGNFVTLLDNGEGILYQSGSTEISGIIVYQHGIAVITDTDLTPYNSFIEETSYPTCSFQSSRTIYETQYKCTIRPEEFNFSLNPTLISGSTEGTVYNFVTGSYFSPYVTTVGFYNESQELLMVAKLGQPLPTSRTTDTTILVNIDK